MLTVLEGKKNRINEIIRFTLLGTIQPLYLLLKILPLALLAKKFNY